MKKGFTNDAIPALSVVESPVEGRLVQAFFDLKQATPVYSTRDDCKISVRFDSCCSSFEMRIQYSPEYLKGKRFDLFFVSETNGFESSLVVEVDGADFHYDKQAHQNDILKDRLSLAKGVPVARFSGSEVFSDAHDVAMEICNLLWISQMNQEYSLRKREPGDPEAATTEPQCQAE